MRIDKCIEVPVATPLAKRAGPSTQLFTTSKMFAYMFSSRYYVSVYGAGLAFRLIEKAVAGSLRKKSDVTRKVQIEVYASWLVDGVFYEKLMRDLPDEVGTQTLSGIIRNAEKYLHHSGPLGKRTPKNFRDEDRNYRLYVDENGVERLRLSSEYQLRPGI